MTFVHPKWSINKSSENMKLYVRFVHFLDLCPSLALRIYHCLLYLRVLLICWRLFLSSIGVLRLFVLARATIGVKLQAG
jgi:hypothetical protein